MSLRKKTLLTAELTLAVMILILFCASQVMLRYEVRVSEEKECLANVQQALDAFSNHLNYLDTALRDWTIWNDTYEFMDGYNEDYITDNLADSTFETLRLNAIAYVNREGRILALGYDLEKEEETPVSQEFLDSLKEGSPLLQLDDIHDGNVGILNLSDGPMLIAVRPVLTSDEEGPANGVMIMARKFGDEVLDRLGQVTHQTLAISGIDDPEASEDIRKASSALSHDKPTFVDRLSGETIASYTILKDLYGNPALVLRVETPRTAYLQARRNIANFTWLILAVGVVFGIVTLVNLERLVLSRVYKLSERVSRIGRDEDSSARVDVEGEDELAALGREINRMLSSLERSEMDRKMKSKQLHELVENQGEGIVITDTENVFTFANPAAHRILGVPEGELIGRKLEDFARPTSAESIRALGEVCKASGPCTYEFEAIHPVDESRVILATATPRLDESGEFTGVFQIFRDITELRRIEQMKTNLAVKWEFLSLISHELRTPLVPILGYTELLLAGAMGELADEHRKVLETIGGRAEALRDLIDHILEFGRLERGTLEIRLEDVEVRDLLEEALAPYLETIQSKPTNIVLESEDLIARADPERLRQVIQNLLGNSLKYSGERVSITVRAFAEDGMARIQVEDDGIGIPRNQVPFIFDLFYQVENVYTRTHQGAGLGLAIVKELVERMGGTVGVTSRYGEGSVFRVSLPLARGLQPELAACVQEPRTATD